MITYSFGFSSCRHTDPCSNTCFYFCVQNMLQCCFFFFKFGPFQKHFCISLLVAGVDVKLGRSEDGQYWVVLVATPIMRRAQLLNAATEIIFIDSTSSCDASRSTVTVLLAATNAGAVPIAVLIHNSQSAQGYCTAFTLLKDTFPTCFGGLSVSYLADKNSQVWYLVSVQIRAGFGVKEQQPCVP